ncbi:MAG: hypothetical protein GX800_05285, partial [Clostridiaceae bacterium]|nr:hypothetical protein [Clostridiaceae bacterium]
MSDDMSYGLISSEGNVIPLKKIVCQTDVSENFALHTLTQKYHNETNSPLSIRYIFPVPSGGVVIDFSAVIGGKKIVSEMTDKHTAQKIASSEKNCATLSKHSSGLLEVSLGCVASAADITIIIKYLTNVHMEDNRLRIIIPTVIAPRYVTYGKQYIIESAIEKPGYDISLNMTYKGKNIANISSPSHDISYEIDSYGANITFTHQQQANKDIIIDIALHGKNRPTMYHYAD